MLINRMGLAAVGLAFAVAAGAGAFLATHQSAPHEAVTAASTAPAPSSDAAAAPPVNETEAVLDAPEVAKTPAPAPEREAARAPTPVAASAARPARRAAPPPHTEAPRARAAPAKAEPRRQPAPEPRIDTESQPPVWPETTERTPVEPRRAESLEAPRLPERRFEDLLVAADSVIGLQLQTTVTSESAQVEDRVEAQVTRDVMAGGRVAIPAGARAIGAVTLVERGGKVKERARIGVRFHTLVLADGTSLPLQTDTVYREGESPANSSAAKIGGGAIGGAVIGAILGGAKGAVIGGSTGAAGGTAVVMTGSRRAATMPAGSSVTVRVLSPVTVTVDR